MSNLVDRSRAQQKLTRICHLAWKKNLMNGWSGNASMKIDQNAILITRAGTPKGFLEPDDFLVLNMQGEILAGSGKPSSEWRMHVRLYREKQECESILHTHPPCLQSLDLRLFQKVDNQEIAENQFLNIPLYEAEMWKSRLYFAKSCAPGSPGLADSCAMALGDSETVLPLAVWLKGHGLCAMANSPENALCLTEELEHIANIQLRSDYM